MTPLRERIEIMMRDHPDLAEKGGVGKLAKIAAVSSSAVSQWKKGSSSMSGQAAARIHAYYGYRIEWLMDGKGPRYPRSSPQIHGNAPVTGILRSQNDQVGIVPVIGVMYMTSTGAVERFAEEEGTPGGIRVHSTDPDACAIRLVGESVGIFRAGWYVLIEPSAAVVAGEPVLLTLKTGKRVLGELLSKANGTISLLGINGHQRMAFLTKDVEAMHPVSAVVSPSKYVE
jgi:hypothetical protein